MLNRKMLAAVFAAALQISSACFAATWTGASNGFPYPSNNNWSNPGNWSGNVVPTPSFATPLIFGPSFRTGTFQDFASPYAVGSLEFSLSSYSLSGLPIAFADSFIHQNSPSLAISNNLILQSNLTYDGFGPATFSGVISGPGGMIKNGPGALTLSANSTYTGTTEINEGQILLANPVALAQSTVVINTHNGLNLNNHEFPKIGGLSGFGNLYLGDVFPTPDPAALVVGANNASTTYSGAITTGGTRWIDKEGTGTLTLTGSGSSFYMIRITSGSVILSGGSIATAIELGDFGNSTPLTIQNGAVVDSRGPTNGIMGNSTIRVTGPGTIWRAGDTRLAFAQGTSGNAIIENGATVTDSSKFIVGQGGPATLLLQSGATITTQVGAIGQNNPAVATATVTGPGTVWTNSTSLSLGGIPPGITGGTGTLNINNGGLVISNGPTILYTAPSAIKVNGGALVTGSLVSSAGIGSIDLVDPSGGGIALTINAASGTSTYAGTITGTGGILKTGASTQILTGPLSYTGPTTVSGGVLEIFEPNLNSKSFRAAGGTIAYKAPFITGGFLRGAGNHDLSAVSRLSATTIASDAVINQSTPLTLLNVTMGGAFTSNAALTLDGTVLTSAARVELNAATTAGGLESNGQLTLAGASTLTHTGTLFLGGGSRTFIGTPADNRARINLAGGTLELNGALLVNNGTISGTTNINFGSLAKGSGVFGTINVTDGGRFSPGNSPGSVTTGSTTWNSGGSYVIEIADALAGAGIGWDTWNINGALMLNATDTTNGRFTVSLSSMDVLADSFDPHLDHDWSILHATNGISNFDPSGISLDTSGFKNSLAGGQFSLGSTANDLIIHFAAVPEPTFIAFFGLMSLLAAQSRRTHR